MFEVEVTIFFSCILIKNSLYSLAIMEGVAQLVRAPGCGPGCRGFDSRRSPFFVERQLVSGKGVRFLDESLFIYHLRLTIY